MIALLRRNFAQRCECEAFRRDAIEIQPLEAREVYRPAIECGHSIDSDAVQPVGTCLVEGDYIGMGLDDVQEKVSVTHVRKAGFFFALGHAWHVINLLLLNARDVALCFGRERRLGQEFGPRLACRGSLRAVGTTWKTSDETVNAERFFVEEVTGPEAAINIAVHALLFQRGEDRCQVR